MYVADFFEKHPLKTKKNVDFKKFARIVRWMNEGKHLQTEGLIEIIELAMQMNREDKTKAKEILQRLKLGRDKDKVHVMDESPRSS